MSDRMPFRSTCKESDGTLDGPADDCRILFISIFNDCISLTSALRYCLVSSSSFLVGGGMSRYPLVCERC